MPPTQRLGHALSRVLRHRLFLLSVLIGAAYLFGGTVSARPPSPGKVPNGNVYYCGTCHESGHVFSDNSPPVPSTPVHGAYMRDPFGSTTPIKTWTLDLANQDSDGDGFTNGEELQDPLGTWAIGKPNPGDQSFVSNPSDNNAANDAYECDLSYRATPPAPLLVDIVGYTSPAAGDLSFGVSTRSPLPIDYVTYLVKNGANQTVYSSISSGPPFRSGVWNTRSAPDGSYTVTAQVTERRQLAGAVPRVSSRSEALQVNNTAPSFGPAGETITPPASPCGIPELLNGVAAVSSDDVWAVGARFLNGPGDQMLIKHWDGARWTSVISPNASLYFNTLSAVAASGPSDVWAVGSYDDGSTTRTLTERWDGAQWRIVPSPNLGASNNRLLGVAATSPSNAWAVGSYDDVSTVSQPVILRWNGASWADVPFFVQSDGTEFTLSGVSAVSASDAWAVGAYRDGSGNRKTLTIHWDGVAWTIFPSPNPNTFLNALTAVTAIAANDVWAVGYTSDGTGDRTLVLHWNGSGWQRVASPSPGAPNNQLLGVAAVSARDVWAVGYANANNDGGVYQTLALHWDGSSWQPVARPLDGDSRLNAVSAAPGGDAWAVGADTNLGAAPALVERYRVTRPTRRVYLPVTLR